MWNLSSIVPESCSTETLLSKANRMFLASLPLSQVIRPGIWPTAYSQTSFSLRTFPLSLLFLLKLFSRFNISLTIAFRNLMYLLSVKRRARGWKVWYFKTGFVTFSSKGWRILLLPGHCGKGQVFESIAD